MMLAKIMHCSLCTKPPPFYCSLIHCKFYLSLAYHFASKSYHFVHTCATSTTPCSSPDSLSRLLFLLLFSNLYTKNFYTLVST